MKDSNNLDPKDLEKVRKESTLLDGLTLPSNNTRIGRVLQILTKTIQSRTKKDIQFILDFAKDHPALSKIMEGVSKRLLLSLLNHKSKQIFKAEQGVMLAKQGDLITHIYFILDGKVAYTEPNKPIPSFSELFEKLSLLANQQMKEINKLKRRNQSLPPQQTKQVKKFPKLNEKQIEDLKFVGEKYNCGMQGRALGIKQITTLVTTADCWIMSIPEQIFLITLHQIMEEKVKMFLTKIQQIPCFKSMEQEKIETFILSLTEKKKARGSTIFKQDEQSHSLYFLTKGEIKLIKNTNLFVENPNNLYVNRLELLGITQMEFKHTYAREENQNKIKQAILPYADLSSMFNFHPMQKNIQLSTTQAFSIIGQEGFVERKKREATALVVSQSVTYYEITLKRIQQILGGPKHLKQFTKLIEVGSKQKILKRQQNFANSIYLENQSNMNYFYDEGKEHQPSKKFRITKLNRFLDQKPQKEKKTSQTQKVKKQINPFYTAFNFNELKPGTTLGSSRVNKQVSEKIKRQEEIEEQIVNQSVVLKSSKKFQQNPQNIRYSTINPEREKRINLKQGDDEETVEVNNKKPGKQEMKVINLTHTWKLIKKKVDVESVKSQKMSPSKHTIDVQSPLIGNQFLVNLQKNKKKLERKIRKQKITLTKDLISRRSNL